MSALYILHRKIPATFSYSGTGALNASDRFGIIDKLNLFDGFFSSFISMTYSQRE